MRATLPVLLALAASLPAQAQAADSARRYALLVGANDGGDGRAILQYAHHDAEGMAEVLVRLGGVDDGDSVVLLDPDSAGLDQALTDLAASVATAGERTEVVFYYSGHSDEEGLLLGGQHYEYGDLRAKLEALDADVRLAILDSCASGAMIRTKGGRKVAPFLVGESNQVGGFAYITSSSADEVAQEAERIGGSYFTHYLATGLRGAADLSADGRVTLDEAYAFAYDETLARTERTQHGPQHANREMNISGQGDLVLTDLKLTTASLVLEEGLAGRAMIRDDDGNLVAELLKPGGRAVELGLGEGHYQVTVTVDGEERYALADVTLAAGASSLLDASDFAWHDAEGAVARGGPTVPQTVVTPPDEAPHHTMRFEVVPGLPEGPDAGVDTLLLGLGAAKAHELDGVAAAFGAVEVEGRSAGLSTAFGVVSAGSLDGVQVSMGINASRDDARGGQLTMGGNFVGGALTGAQTTFGVNHAASVEGLQISAGVNHTHRLMDGFQGTAGVNVAGELRGLQLGSVNVARSVQGAQIGLVNVGGDVRGTQIGLVNVATRVEGVPIGLLSFVKEGRHDLLFYASETDLVNVELKLGGGALHTILGGGVMPDRHAWLGLGYGGHAPFGEILWLDLDLLATGYVPVRTVTQSVDGTQLRFTGPLSEPPTSVIKARATLGAQLTKDFALFGGAAMNFRLPIEGVQLLDVAPSYLADPEQEVIAWPGFFAGVQF